MAPAEVELTDEPTALYRLYGTRGELLYVGVTKDLPARFAQHAAEKSWWPLVARKTAELHGSRRDAMKAELAAIHTESPVHNIAGQRAEPRQGKYKLPPILRKPSSAPRRPAQEFVFAADAAVLSWIESYAEEKKYTLAKAAAELVFMGRMKAYQDDLAAIATERAELEEIIAARTTAVAS